MDNPKIGDVMALPPCSICGAPRTAVRVHDTIAGIDRWEGDAHGVADKRGNPILTACMKYFRRRLYLQNLAIDTLVSGATHGRLDFESIGTLKQQWKAAQNACI